MKAVYQPRPLGRGGCKSCGNNRVVLNDVFVLFDAAAFEFEGD